MRLFVGIDVPDVLRDHLANGVSELKQADRNGTWRWVSPERYHVSLLFLGETAPETIPSMDEQLRMVALSTDPITLTVKGIGLFGPRFRPRTLWAGVQGPVELDELQTRVVAACRAAGCTIRGESFRGHITLARKRRRDEPFQWARKIGELQNRNFGVWPVNELVLWQSVLSPAGPDYTVQGRYSLVEHGSDGGKRDETRG